MNIRYLVKYDDGLTYNEPIFSEHETEKQALAKVNEIMIATNDDTKVSPTPIKLKCGWLTLLI
jgi:hypothetical protein